MDSSLVIKFFEEITKIPRESGHEEKIAEYLINFAKERNLEYKKDKVGNVLIIKEASKGKEDVPSLVLQSHQDMVCEKTPESTHNFETDPIKYVIEDGWMIAKETTLGADDGIGVAASLALLDSDIAMGRLECLFTTSEETGMDGAMGLEEGFFTSKTLINLDSEDEGQLFVGCAGGLNTTIDFDIKREAILDGYKQLKLKVFGGQGGHSGDDINKLRMNAVQQMARFLYTLPFDSYQLLDYNGGNKYNAIPRDAEAVIAIPSSEFDKVKAELERFSHTISSEFATSDPNVKASCEEVNTYSSALDKSVTTRLIRSLVALHNGIAAMSQDIPDLVETSSHLAFVKVQDSKIIVGTSQRSSVDTAKMAVADKVKACFELAGANVVRSDIYPGWKPNMQSHVMDRTVEAYKKIFNVEPKVKAIHAGLECGLFLEKFPYLDMISFGPTLKGCHAPGERLNLESNEKFVKLLVEVVTNYS